MDTEPVWKSFPKLLLALFVLAMVKVYTKELFNPSPAYKPSSFTYPQAGPKLPNFPLLTPYYTPPGPSISPALPPASVSDLGLPAPASQAHVWKNRAQKEISAKMLSFDGTNVVLETADGKTYTYPLTGLSDESQELARTLAAPAPAVADSAPAVSVEMRPPTGRYNTPEDLTSNGGPLTVRTAAGSGDCYVKLVDKRTGYARMVFFIRSGETLHEDNVPAGTYQMRYATGSIWQGEKDLFGASTVYSQAGSDLTFGNGMGLSVELIQQVGGNLATNPIDKGRF